MVKDNKVNNIYMISITVNKKQTKLISELVENIQQNLLENRFKILTHLICWCLMKLTC